ncbi:MAG TPA: hypothetical protein VFO55_03745 [Gemmatimonadaceae bacterium]|nr:hypothetical protein [Gemmatimonadaceae bacterium]
MPRLRSWLFSAVGVALAAHAAVASAQISVLSSTVEEKEATRGETYTGRIVISNPTSTPQPVRIFKTDYGFHADGRTMYDDPGTTPRSNASWVTPQTERIVVPPRSEVTVPYTVTVPASDSLRGTYWSTIMVEGAETAPAPSGRGQSQVGIGSIIRYAIQVATHVGAAGARTVKFENPVVGRTATGEATLDLVVVATGERAVKPKLSVEIYDEQGALKANGKQDRGLVYPGSSFNQHFDFGKLPAGTYKAVVFADTGDERVFATQFTIKY